MCLKIKETSRLYYVSKSENENGLILEWACLSKIKILKYLLEMSSSCEVSEPSRAGALQFSSWNRADNTDNMYVKK